MLDQSISVLNDIRAIASTAYQDRIPVATRDNIVAVGNAILEYDPTYNEFSNLLNKIGMTIVNNALADNVLAQFKGAPLPYGTTVEEIWVEQAKAEGAFDPTGANPLGRRLSDIKVYYHAENLEEFGIVRGAIEPSLRQSIPETLASAKEKIKNVLNVLPDNLRGIFSEFVNQKTPAEASWEYYKQVQQAQQIQQESNAPIYGNAERDPNMMPSPALDDVDQLHRTFIASFCLEKLLIGRTDGAIL
jgi:hypothetical protein